jgi:soluble cytochrome b562
MSFSLIYWLRKTPQPVTVLADDQRIEVPRNGRAWRDLTATIQALDPSKLTCLDAQGKVIRSKVLESEEDKPAASPEMTDLQLFAKLLAEGYQHGMRANQPIIDNAMQFVERQGVRLAKAEAEIERLRGLANKQHLEIARLSNMPAPSDDGGIMGAIVAGALQSQAQAAANGGGNGAAANGGNGALAPKGPKK